MNFLSYFIFLLANETSVTWNVTFSKNITHHGTNRKRKKGVPAAAPYTTYKERLPVLTSVNVQNILPYQNE